MNGNRPLTVTVSDAVPKADVYLLGWFRNEAGERVVDAVKITGVGAPEDGER